MIYKNELCSLIVEYFCNSLNYLIPSRLIMYTSILVPHKENKANLPHVKETSEFSTGAHISKDHREIYRIWRTWGETKVSSDMAAILICLWLFGNKPKLLNMLLFEAFLSEYVDPSWEGSWFINFHGPSQISFNHFPTVFSESLRCYHKGAVGPLGWLWVCVCQSTPHKCL